MSARSLALAIPLTFAIACGGGGLTDPVTAAKDAAVQQAQDAAGRKVAELIVEGAAEPGTDVSFSKEGLTLKTADGLSATAGDLAQLPATFPKEVPLCDGAKLQIGATTDGGKTHLAVLTCPKPPAETAAFYEKLPGFSIKEDMRIDASRMMSLENPEARLRLAVQVALGETPETSAVTLSTMPLEVAP